ncbi:MAG: hypothetical protein OXF33_09445 [Rhodospirillales bacterium]|nr:hypothetical protein [Rhodospirillales bacterium]
MASSSTNLRDDLVEVGVEPKQAAVIARAFAVRHRGPSTATWAGFGLAVLIAVLTWLATGIDANRDRIDAVNERLSTFETGVSERLTRIETLLDERLPERR